MVGVFYEHFTRPPCLLGTVFLNCIIPSTNLLPPVLAMTLKELITTHYGVGTHRLGSSYSRQMAKQAAIKNHFIFLERCLFLFIIPIFLQNRSPMKSPRARRITKCYEVCLLRESLFLERTKWHRSSNKIRRTQDTLKAKLSEEHFALISCIAHGTYKKCFLHHRTNMKDWHKNKVRLSKAPRALHSLRIPYFSCKRMILCLRKRLKSSH